MTLGQMLTARFIARMEIAKATTEEARAQLLAQIADLTTKIDAIKKPH